LSGALINHHFRNLSRDDRQKFSSKMSKKSKL